MIFQNLTLASAVSDKYYLNYPAIISIFLQLTVMLTIRLLCCCAEDEFIV